jgi:NRAMP (natural resistance-associated macrophage protein)-like metal ion transporter
MKLNLLKNIGPGTLVAAAFIGPGTVTVCTQAGVQFGYVLLWALLLSTIATIILQGFSARLGLITGKGLAELLRMKLKNSWLRYASLLLILVAIFIGNSAYEAGNISGGVLGLETVVDNSTWKFGSLSINGLTLLTGTIAFIVLFIGNYKILEKILVTLVILMSISFLIAAIITAPNLLEIFKGLFVPKTNEESLLTVIALVGTTVVPYNLFLHASLIREKWKDSSMLSKVRTDTMVSVGLGGMVSMAIMICAAGVQTKGISNGADLAKGLEPLYGESAKYLLGIGLFAAGITSAITAPIAAAYVSVNCFGWNSNMKSIPFRLSWMIVLLVGIIVSSLGIEPIELIQFAQIANGLLLPIIVAYLLWLANKKSILNQFVNNKWQNLSGVFILLLTILLSFRVFMKVFEIG